MSKSRIYIAATAFLVLANVLVGTLSAEKEPVDKACWCFEIDGKDEPFCLDTTVEPECTKDSGCTCEPT